jgi:hypothetical protein
MCRRLKDSRIILQQTDRAVTRLAKQAPYVASYVIVVDTE